MLKTKTSPNFDERREGARPSMLILHYTGMRTGEEALNKLCDPGSKVSAHYFIEESGKILQLVEDQHRAWHAGVANWNGETDINSCSIGIELVNPGYEFGYQPFPEKQIAAAVELCQMKMKEWDIPQAQVLAHSDVAPERKQDPGHLFPWEKLAQQGVGAWPQPQEMDYQAAEDIIKENQSLAELLDAYGYNVANNLEEVLAAYHRHFYPEKFQDGNAPNEPDVLSIAKLLSLIRSRHET